MRQEGEGELRVDEDKKRVVTFFLVLIGEHLQQGCRLTSNDAN